MHLTPAAVQTLNSSLASKAVNSTCCLPLHTLSFSSHLFSSPKMLDRVSQLVAPLAWHERLVSSSFFFPRSHMLPLNICCCLYLLMGPSEIFLTSFLFPRHFHIIFLQVPLPRWLESFSGLHNEEIRVYEIHQFLRLRKWRINSKHGFIIYQQSIVNTVSTYF